MIIICCFESRDSGRTMTPTDRCNTWQRARHNAATNACVLSKWVTYLETPIMCKWEDSNWETATSNYISHKTSRKALWLFISTILSNILNKKCSLLLLWPIFVSPHEKDGPSPNHLPSLFFKSSPFFLVGSLRPQPLTFASRCGRIHLCRSLSKIVTMQQLPQ